MYLDDLHFANEGKKKIDKIGSPTYTDSTDEPASMETNGSLGKRLDSQLLDEDCYDCIGFDDNFDKIQKKSSSSFKMQPL
jgi:hypothetical protein